MSTTQSARKFEELKHSLGRVLFWGLVSIGFSLLSEWMKKRSTQASSKSASGLEADEAPYQPTKPTPRDIVDYASEQSFPASDAPSWH